MKLSVLIPVYNERYLAAELIGRVLEAPLPEDMDRELIVVDDGSTDGSREILRQLAQSHPESIRLIEHLENRGKGAAIRSAIAAATGEFCIFQDADLEYDPREYGKVLGPLLSGQADVVYGSRFLTGERRRVLYYWHRLGNSILTTLSNVFTDLDLTDMETCYKAFRTQVLKSLPIRCNGFGIEPEITAKVAKRGLRVYEVPISYDGRTYAEGKKITWKDGARALFVILKYWLIDDVYDEKSGQAMVSSTSRTHRFDQWVAETMVRPHLGHRVLEIGAGIGNITIQFLPRERYIAGERRGAHLEVLKALALRRASLEAARLDPDNAADFEPYRGAMDTVLCLHALEQAADPGSVLRHIHAVLKPGGKAVILAAQGPWLYSRLDTATEQVRRFTRADLSELLQAAGFGAQEFRQFNRVGALGWALNGKLLRRSRMPRWQLKLFDSLVWLWRRTDWLLPWPGLSLLAVARKPEGETPPKPALIEAAASARVESQPAPVAAAVTAAAPSHSEDPAS